MNQQQIFDVVVHHAINQHSKAMAHSGRCKYLAEDGKQCFVGVLIPRDTYHPDMESKGVRFLTRKFPKVIPLVLPTDMEFNRAISFMEQLQQIHDSTQVIFWDEGLRKMATKHGLKFMEKES